VGDKQIELTFVQTDDGGSPIINYLYSLDGGVSFTGFSPQETTSPVIITGLTNGATYQIGLKAENTTDTSLSSAFIQVKLNDVPSAPFLTGGYGGDMQIFLYFNEPNNGGKPILNYRYSLDGGNTFTFFYPPQTTPPLFIDGLTNNVLYYVCVQAINELGASATSNVLRIKPMNTTPKYCCPKEVLQNKKYLDTYPNISNNMKKSILIQSSQNGRTTFGDYLYGGIKPVNYVGKINGQLGGSGQPIRNKF
jgi:hypothetical protein